MHDIELVAEAKMATGRMMIRRAEPECNSYYNCLFANGIQSFLEGFHTLWLLYLKLRDDAREETLQRIRESVREGMAFLKKTDPELVKNLGHIYDVVEINR